MWETDKMSELKENLYEEKKKGKWALQAISGVSLYTFGEPKYICTSENALSDAISSLESQFPPKILSSLRAQRIWARVGWAFFFPKCLRSLPSLQGEAQLRNAAFPGSRGRRCCLHAQRDHNPWAVLMTATAQEVFEASPRGRAGSAPCLCSLEQGRVGPLLLLLLGDCSVGIWYKPGILLGSWSCY